MDLFKSKLISILSVAILTLSIGTIASAQELNLPGFSGTVNTTVTSGVSMRVERNCLSVRGTQYQDGDTNDKSIIEFSLVPSSSCINSFTTS